MRQACLKGEDSRLMEQENFLAVQYFLPACGQSKLSRKLNGFEHHRGGVVISPYGQGRYLLHDSDINTHSHTKEQADNNQLSFSL
jgi:hypothetical protein